MTQRSTMFLNNVTAIDFAFIDDTGWIQGGSLNPTFLITGKVDPIENVVIDFSTVKKIIKEVIDGKENGFDHKLWYIKGVSEINSFNDLGSSATILTNKVTLHLPNNAIKIIDYPLNNTFKNYPEIVSRAISTALEIRLNEMYPGFDIKVTTRLLPDIIPSPYANSATHAFRYVHGLKNSTSWGCQNIAHGHFSYISAETENPYLTNFLLAKVAAFLDNSVFVWKENLTETSDRVSINYTTDRGYFAMSLDREKANYFTMNKETTIENIVEVIAETFRQDFIEAGVTTLYISEGLNKGATYSF